MDIKYSIVAGFMVTLGVCVVIFIPSFVVVFDVTANKTEFVGTFDRSPFSFSFLMALKWSALLVLFLLVGICIMVFIPSAIVGYQEAQNKREFLSNFLATTSFGILLLIVAGAKIDTSHRNKRFILRLWPRCITLTFCHEIITIKDEKEWSLARIEPTEDLKRELEEKEERIRALEAENRDLQEQLRLSAERVEEMEQGPSVLQHMIFKKERLGGILVAIGILAIVVSVAFAYVYQITAN
ncbi:hypothetical protein QR680_016667 [Steinernema hermaphroditum]|uniref:Uncharacterized protein n=1 Tax=Steinernema hermaphroditum TaxID=289476 RepID=A0AA39LN05_9BILA|nr:hypothetical protein QR680_016667 [Steinernema hermaphroditum]